MLSLFFGSVSAFLAVRQVLIASYRKWNLFAAVLTVFFSLVALLAAPHAIKNFSLEHFSYLAAILFMWACFDLYALKKNTYQFSKFRFILGAVFVFLSCLFISCVTLPHLYMTEAILHIKATAEEKKELVTWKTPSGPLQTETITSHRILIEDMQSHVLFDGYLYGDLATIRLKILSFPLWLQWLGVPHLWTAEAISCDYLKLEQKKQGPTDTFFLSSRSIPLWQKLLFSFWEKTFFYEGRPFFIHSASLSSTHFPLVDRQGKPVQGSFHLNLSKESATPFTAQVERN
ncbi:MAG: hypothetical protein NTX49_07590 [Chlamydiae bacterium]|nr:hypothetical protein [Chlamydiota bacterium]